MGEVYRLGPALDPSSLPPPATEARQEARRLEQEGNWDELLETLETTLAEEAGRGWLDGHRLAHTSLVQLGFETASRAVLALLRSWLSDYPDWPITELNDYTPAANNATRTWVAEQITPPREEAFPAPLPPPSFIEEPGEEEAEGPEPRPPDLWEQAQELRRQGRIAEAFVLLARAARSATNGRDRFLRTLQQARFCLDAQRADFALPLLEDLARQIDTLHLDHWEDGSLLAQVFAGLYRCLKTSDPERARLVYSRLCQLDLSLALACETTDSG
jgi:type VI secretion system ImpA/VasJ family protein